MKAEKKADKPIRKQYDESFKRDAVALWSRNKATRSPRPHGDWVSTPT
jgi:hypothetical protein